MCREVGKNQKKAHDSSAPMEAYSEPWPLPGPRDTGEGVTVTQGCARVKEHPECGGTQRQESEICPERMHVCEGERGGRWEEGGEALRWPLRNGGGG